jgi:putative DNA primase/helicase
VLIPEKHRDKQLAAKLKKERNGILGWMLEGCTVWLDNDGLIPPKGVREATDDYFRAEDTIALFLDECCELDAQETFSSSKLFARWKQWAETRAEYVGSQKWFTQQLQDRGFRTKKTSRGVVFIGLTISE